MKKWIISGTVALIIPLFAFYHTDKDLNELKNKYALSPSKFIAVDGMDVHYRIEGKGQNLLLIHGTSSSLHTWQGWVDRLKKDFKIIRLDMPAFGLTGPNPQNDYSLSSYTKFLDLFMRRLNINNFHIAGNSLGGGIAWKYTLTHPHKVNKLILIDSIGFPIEKNSSILSLAKVPFLKNIYPNFSSRWLIKKSLHQVYFNDKLVTDTLIDRYYDLSLRPGNRKALIKRMEAHRSYNIEDYSKIKNRTLVLWGKEDEWIPSDHAIQFGKYIQSSRVVILPDCGHLPMEEIPQKTADIVKEFLLHY